LRVTLKNRKVLLINSNRIKPAVAPIALDYLAQSLKESGYSVDLLDLCFCADYRSAFDQYLRENSPGVIAITIRNLDDAHSGSRRSFLPGIRKMVVYLKERISVPVILGGVGFSIAPEKVLQYCQANLGIRGEGEHSLPMLLDRLFSERDYTDVPGLVYRAGGEYKVNAEKYVDLARLPTQPRSFVDNHRYFVEGGQGSIETKRGCDQQCIYCVDPVSKGKRIRVRPPQHVADELEALLSKGINCFHTCDSEFNIPEDHAKEVCEELIKRGLSKQISWYAYASPKPFSGELASLMKRSGCVGIDFGVDSGNDRMLERLGRDFTQEDIRKVAGLCHRYGITFMFDLLLGGPGETKASVEETIELMHETKPSMVGVTVGIRIYPGTKMAEMIRGEGPIFGNRNLFGIVEGNEDFLEPVFYISEEVGKHITSWVTRLTGGNRRFLFADGEDPNRDYNYNDNAVLVEAIRKGYRGAYWDILRRRREEND